jgi:hypothetical protein
MSNPKSRTKTADINIDAIVLERVVPDVRRKDSPEIPATIAELKKG